MAFNFILLGINIIVVCIFFLILRRRIDRSIKSTELLTQIETELDRVLTELNQTTDRNINLIEDRIEKLSKLLEESDRRMVLFKKEQDKLDKTAGKGLGIYTKPMPLKLHMVDENPDGREVSQPAGGSSSSYSASGAQGKNRSAASSTSAANAPPAAPSSREKVLRLDYEGLSPQEIASQMGMSLGEIELILSLHRESRKGKSDG